MRSGPRLLETLAPYEALSEFLHLLIAHSAASLGMAAALQSVMNTGSPVFARARTAMTDAIASVMTAAAEAGAIRTDSAPETVFRAMGGICTSYDRPDWEAGARAILRLLLDRLHYGAADPRG
ncbi:hypothetical protein [Kitasatospora sp. NPDC085879]|uniref:SbtR family transcriptional regulator n=1 Tax=Kitasatospora sp. NPDC085879 TaxID=3154769 RepID=UPI0034346306